MPGACDRDDQDAVGCGLLGGSLVGIGAMGFDKVEVTYLENPA